MKHTKNILKSLLIMIVAISLFTVSCSKDEGGTKNPTNPTPKNSEALLTDMLKGLGQLTPSQADTTVILDFGVIVFNEDGTAIIDGADNTKEGADYKVKKALENTFKKSNFADKIGLQNDLTVNNPTSGNSDALSVDITFIANGDYTFDKSITEGKRYAYNTGDSSAKLTLKISPKGQW